MEQPKSFVVSLCIWNLKVLEAHNSTLCIWAQFSKTHSLFLYACYNTKGWDKHLTYMYITILHFSATASNKFHYSFHSYYESPEIKMLFTFHIPCMLFK